MIILMNHKLVKLSVSTFIIVVLGAASLGLAYAVSYNNFSSEAARWVSDNCTQSPKKSKNAIPNFKSVLCYNYYKNQDLTAQVQAQQAQIAALKAVSAPKTLQIPVLLDGNNKLLGPAYSNGSVFYSAQLNGYVPLDQNGNIANGQNIDTDYVSSNCTGQPYISDVLSFGDNVNLYRFRGSTNTYELPPTIQWQTITIGSRLDNTGSCFARQGAMQVFMPTKVDPSSLPFSLPVTEPVHLGSSY